jgi:polyvinyl alcohol dehydrogenase (cytochrome)
MRYLVLLVLSAGTVLAQDGAQVYRQHCAGCHDTPTARVPPFTALRAMDAGSIIRSLESGVMKTQAAGLTSAERYAVVGYLASPAPQSVAPPPAAAFCSPPMGPLSDASQAPHWGVWGANSANTRFQEVAAAGIGAADVPRLKLKWAFGLGTGTAVHSQPAIVGGHAFVANLTGQVYSLDARTGCIHWTFAADAPVRSALVFGELASGGTDGSTQSSAIYFGDQRGNAYAVNATTGKLLWRVHVDDHFAALITGAPQFHRGVLYVPVTSYEELLPPSPTYECCTFRGSVVALDAATGQRIWKTYTIVETPHATEKSKNGTQLYGPSGAAVWSTPTFDENNDVLYAATGDNYSEPATKTSDAVLALDAKTGKILWSKQLTAGDIYNNGCASPAKTNCPDAHGEDFDFGQPPILVSLANGHRALVIGQKSGMVHALDPERQGEILWQKRIGPGGALGGIQWGSAADREKMYVALSGIQFAVVPDNAAPQGYSFGVDPKQGGGLFALRLSTGETAWSAKPADCGERKHCSPAQSAAVTAIPGVVFSGSEDGHLRAYATAGGEVIWDADTVRDYDTVNGQKARGGSLDVAGPVIAGGMLYVNSGYGQWGGMPGNVLLAFSVDGK